MNKKKIKISLLIVINISTIVILFFLGIRVFHTFKYSNDSYYEPFKENQQKSNVKNEEESKSENDDNKTYTTIIDHTRKYTNQNIINKQWVIDFIKKESIEQENNCNNNLKDIEEEISDFTKIYGINFCELSRENAENIKESLKYVYTNYPWIQDYVTNITLVNDGGENSYIAAFQPSFTYMTSNTNNKFPFVIKIQVFLNAAYYLNDNYFGLVIKNASKSNHFPTSTTKESLVVHEFGHVITYILAINYYNSNNTLLVNQNDFSKYANTLKNYTNQVFAKQIIDEAYQNYIKEYQEESEENFRKNISGYANSFDNNGNVLYNETIAESFHDYYLHKNSAKLESISVINVLNKYIEEINR